LFLSPDGIASTTGGGGGYLNVVPTTVVPPARTNRTSLPLDASALPPSVRQTNDLDVFSDIVLGYINRMLMAKDIDDRFEHYLEHPTMFAPLLTTSLSLSCLDGLHPSTACWLPQSAVPHQVGHGRQRCRVWCFRRMF
jgi:hypothetical protein